MPHQTTASPQPPSGVSPTFLEVIVANPNILRDLLRLWTIALADPEIPESGLKRIGADIDIIAWGLVKALDTIRRRRRALEAEGYGSGGAERTRGVREEPGRGGN
ncbi:hypothetical protein HOY80DRAFT_1040459 [Tuber brumale]|nr:hypothetical protein HOY80DRAFT_1040459 [Tuber brumale]